MIYFYCHALPWKVRPQLLFHDGAEKCVDFGRLSCEFSTCRTNALGFGY